MTRQLAVRRCARVTTVLLGVGLLACHPNREEAAYRHDSVESEDEVAGHGPRKLGGPLGDPKVHGWHKRATPDMPMDINDMADSDFVKYVSSLEYDTQDKRSHLVDAKCVHDDDPTNPCGSDEGAQLYIEPEIGAHLKDFPRPGSHGYIVARIINYDPSGRFSTVIKFKPHTRYWWVVNYNSQTGQPQSLFVSRNYKATSPLDTVPGTFGFVDCRHPKQDYKRAEAKFGTCARFLPRAVARGSGANRAGGSQPSEGLAEYIHPVSFRASMPTKRPMTASLLTGGWISCPTGCCSTQ